MTLRDILIKKCCTCGEEKSLDQFHRNAAHPGGLSIRCKPCHKKKNLEYRRRHKAKINERNRASYYRNKPARRIIQKRYEQKIKEATFSDKTLQAKRLLDNARIRAKRYGIPIAITWRDIEIPDVCPVLGIPLKVNKRSMGRDSPSLDRIIPSLGYVPGNILVVSMRANQIKTDANPEEILRVAMFYSQMRSL